MLHLQRGDRFLAPAQAHVLGSELGTGAWLAGGMPEALPWEGGPGRITPMQVWRAAGSTGPLLRPAHHAAVPGEHPQLRRRRRALTGAEHRALVEQAQAAGLKVHLDGARLWHAAAALGQPLAALAWGVDTVSGLPEQGAGRAHGLGAVRLPGRHGPGPAPAQDAGRRGAPGRA